MINRPPILKLRAVRPEWGGRITQIYALMLVAADSEGNAEYQWQEIEEDVIPPKGGMRWDADQGEWQEFE